MTHEQLVEKVAAAIYESHPAYQGTARVHRIEWDQARHGISGTECHRQARAAIAAIYEAMREPTMRMIMDGVHYRLNTAISSENPWPEDTVTFFRAMLEASPLKGE